MTGLNLTRQERVWRHETATARTLYSPVQVTLAGIAVFSVGLRATRLISLLPILVDESIYLRWAEIIQHQGQWFISLLDAKQPFSYWIYAALRMLCPNVDPLLSARSVSVVAGLASTLLLFLLGRQLGGVRVGLVTALFYAVLPYGVLYDRVAYTDALVNLFGIALTLASVWCFDSRPSYRRALAPGLLLGLGFFIKSTMLLFVLTPLVASFVWHGPERSARAPRLALIYGIALIFPIWSWFSVPEAPVFGVNNLVLHHTNFFTPLAVLLRHPLQNALPNSAALVSYWHSYVSLPLAAFGVFSLAFLARKGERSVWLAVPVFCLPIAFQLIFMQFTQSRYFFPHAWPLLLFSALGVVKLRALSAPGRLTVAALCLSALPLYGSICMLRDPASQLNDDDAVQFINSGPFSGYGIAEAVGYLRLQSREQPITILTDPIWGPPADAIYPYLNLWHGTRVYDAWWQQLPDTPILPTRQMEVMKSQYERVSAGTIHFQDLQRVFYVTDTNYRKPADVWKREPGARLVHRFPKRNGLDSIDVYRLR